MIVDDGGRLWLYANFYYSMLQQIGGIKRLFVSIVNDEAIRSVG